MRLFLILELIYTWYVLHILCLCGFPLGALVSSHGPETYRVKWKLQTVNVFICLC